MKYSLRAFVSSCFMLSAAVVSCGNKASDPAIGDRIYTESNAVLDKDQRNSTINGSRSNAITSVAKQCSPAIVGINVTEVRKYQVRDPFDFGFNDPFFERFFGRRQPQTYSQKVESLGSGFLISSDGFIVTNDHVAGKASKIVVTLSGGEKYDAEIIGSDPTTDVALLKINGKNLPYLKLGNSEDVLVGEWAIAFGNPFGLFDKNAKPTMTVGVVSNTGVNFTEESETVNGKRVYRNMIQTDAAISSGNSGGPLVNAVGEVMGVNTVIFSTAQSYRGAGSIGIGFAIPINRVKAIVDRLRSGAKLDREFYTGLSIQEINEQSAKALGLKISEGILVSQVMTNSPADKAGLEPGDVILEIDGVPVHSQDDVGVAINDGVVGQSLEVKVLRDNDTKTMTMTLERRK